MPEPLVDWRFQVVDAWTMDVIDDITHALDKKLSLVLNRPGSLSFRLNIDDDVAPALLSRRAGIIAIRNKIDVWGGYINTRDADAESGYISFSAVGWMERLYERIVRNPLTRGTEADADRAFALLDDANNQVTSLGGGQPTSIWKGAQVGVFQPRGPHVYERGVSHGAEIQALSDLEAGFDITVNPRTLVMDLYAWDQYSVKPTVIFGYRWGPENLVRMSWQEDGGRMCNSMLVVGKSGNFQFYDDPEAISIYGLKEEMVSLSDVSDQNILLAYANAEVSIRSRPWVTYTILPYPYDGSDSIPQIYDDFKVGDMVYFFSSDPIIRVHDQAVRIFGADIEVTSEGHEIISSLSITNQGGGQ
jgi:hypothetical protein